MAEQPRAACADTTEPEVFFPDFRGRPGLSSKTQVKRHLNMVWNAYCSHCPVIDECIQEGRKPGNWGIWGGMYFPLKSSATPSALLRAGTSDMAEQGVGGVETLPG